ncbi:MAG: ROK family protein [Chloroflexota bacterium]|nr:ROK family protein [Chloroflexota bacterium]
MIVGVDIGGTKIAVGLVDDKGQVHARAECPTEPERGFPDGLERIAALTRGLPPVNDIPARGIGIGCTGPVFPESGIIGNVDFLPGWENAPIVAELERRFGLPVAMENDADAAALGEWMWGAGRDVRTFLYVTISTGIGVGLIVDGQLYRGVDGAHPEIGHHVIDPAGPACACGAHGCWESLASGSAMQRWFRDNAPAEHSDMNLSAREICTRADAHAKATVARTGRYLGLGLANLVTLFTPEVIAIGGGLMRRRDLFWPQIQETIQSSCGFVPREKVRLVPAALGDDVGIIGAACAWTLRYRSNQL